MSQNWKMVPFLLFRPILFLEDNQKCDLLSLMMCVRSDIIDTSLVEVSACPPQGSGDVSSFQPWPCCRCLDHE